MTMPTREQVLQVFRQYARDPQQELEAAKHHLHEAELDRDRARTKLAEHDDEAIYEVHDWGDWYCTKREILKVTAKQIWLAPEYLHGKKRVLPRDQIEAGEFVRTGNRWWCGTFCLGRVIRERVAEELQHTELAVQRHRDELQRIEATIARGDLLLPQEIARLLSQIRVSVLCGECGRPYMERVELPPSVCNECLERWELDWCEQERERESIPKANWKKNGF